MFNHPVSYREASYSDTELLANIRVIAMRPSLEAIGRFDAQRAKERLLNNFQPTLTQVIEYTGLTVGFYSVHEYEDHLYIAHLYLLPDFQGLGIGNEVLRMIATSAASQSKPIKVGALKGSPANEFYKKHGFELERVEEWDNYYVYPTV